MNELNKVIGNYGEDLALSYLISHNHKLIKRNYKKRNGEIDIITTFKDIIVFTEVKTRSNNFYGKPCEYVDTHKQNRIKSLAKYFINVNKYYDYYIRFDVIEININNYNNEYNLNHLIDAFR